MTPTKARDLLGVGLVVAVLGNLLVRFAYGWLPGIPLLAGATLGLLGAAEAVVGSSLRARIRHRPGARPVQPLVAARAVLVAKASSMAGAVMAGWWAGLLAYVVPRSADVSAAAADTAAGVVGLVCALGLVAGALWLEHCCRTPDDPDDERGEHP
jgi:hypothetical protein